MRSNRAVVASFAALSTAMLAGCGSAESFAGGDAEKQIIVGSANFPENLILGEIYAGALESAGFAVTRQLDVGSRDILYGELTRCNVTVAPEYNGSLLAYLDPEAQAQGTEDIIAAIESALDPELQVLEPSAAENTNVLAVLSTTAQEQDLTDIADLAPIAGELTLGAPPELESRLDGLVGLKEEYGIEFGTFTPLDYAGPITVSALREGDIDVALMFSASPELAGEEMTVLTDSRGVLGENYVLPLACSAGMPDGAADVLDGVSAELTTEDLIAMNSRYAVDRADIADIAADWIAQNLPAGGQ